MNIDEYRGIPNRTKQYNGIDVLNVLNDLKMGTLRPWKHFLNGMN